MPSTTYSEFGHDTEARDVAKAFADRIRGKTVIVTGGNRNGIAFTTAEAFASQNPAHLIIAGRTPSKLQETIDALKSEFPDVDYRALRIDLSSQESVRSVAAELLSWSDVPTVDFVINSAGVMGIPERTITPDGIEVHFATNHIGHWLFSCLIAPKLIKASEGKEKGSVRIVNVSSGSPFLAGVRWSDINFEKINKDLPEDEQPPYQFLQMWGYSGLEEQSYVPLEGYNQSKVSNVLFGIGANKRLLEKHGILTTSVHPGVIQTELSRDFAAETLVAVDSMAKNGVFTFKTLGAGSSTTLVAALDPKLADGENTEVSVNHGAFLADCQISDKANPRAVSSENGEKLWKLSEKLVKQEFSW